VKPIYAIETDGLVKRYKQVTALNGMSLRVPQGSLCGLILELRATPRTGAFGGMALPSSMERLPMGDGFQCAIANYLSAGGQFIEGAGVQPGVLVEPTHQQLRDGQDPTLAAADRPPAEQILDRYPEATGGAAACQALRS
jgi:hypothetical protein